MTTTATPTSKSKSSVGSMAGKPTDLMHHAGYREAVAKLEELKNLRQTAQQRLVQANARLAEIRGEEATERTFDGGLTDGELALENQVAKLLGEKDERVAELKELRETVSDLSGDRHALYVAIERQQLRVRDQEALAKKWLCAEWHGEWVRLMRTLGQRLVEFWRAMGEEIGLRDQLYMGGVSHPPGGEGLVGNGTFVNAPMFQHKLAWWAREHREFLPRSIPADLRKAIGEL